MIKNEPIKNLQLNATMLIGNNEMFVRDFVEA